MQQEWIVVFRAKDDLQCNTRMFGPFWYMEAEDFLATLPVAAECDCKYIQKLERTYDRSQAPLPTI